MPDTSQNLAITTLVATARSHGLRHGDGIVFYGALGETKFYADVWNASDGQTFTFRPWPLPRIIWHLIRRRRFGEMVVTVYERSATVVANRFPSWVSVW